jgi:hypothetical protein
LGFSGAKVIEASAAAIAVSAAVAKIDMRQFVDIVRIPTPGRGLVEITPEVVDWLRPHAVRTGLLTLFCRHASAGLLIQENASREVRVDLEAFFDRLAPEEAGDTATQTKAATTCPPTSAPRLPLEAGQSGQGRPAPFGNLAEAPADPIRSIA